MQDEGQKKPSVPLIMQIIRFHRQAGIADNKRIVKKKKKNQVYYGLSEIPSWNFNVDKDTLAGNECSWNIDGDIYSHPTYFR